MVLLFNMFDLFNTSQEVIANLISHDAVPCIANRNIILHEFDVIIAVVLRTYCNAGLSKELCTCH